MCRCREREKEGKKERNVVDGVALPGIDMERKERTDLDEYTLLAHTLVALFVDWEPRIFVE